MKLFLVSTDSYLKYFRFVDTKYNNIYNKLFLTLKRLKDDDPETSSHTVAQLVLKFHVLYPVLSPADAESLSEAIKGINEAQIEAAQASELLTKLRQRSLANNIALKAVSVAAEEGSFSELQALIQEAALDEDKADESPFVSDDILVVRDRHIAEPPFEFRLKTLNSILGGLRRRTFGFIFARPETGKTQLLASEATFLAPQVPSCILWINNEEDGLALVTRSYQAALVKDADWIFKNAETARNEYIKKIKGKIKIYDRPAATDRDIERVVRECKPDVILIDQLDKVRGFADDKERHDLLQKAKYQWARELAKIANAAVVGVCQAGGTAEGKKYLDMNDVDSSKTGKQGEADWMFGLGSSSNVGDEDFRYISVCKNKLPPAPAMVSQMRHAKIPVKSLPEVQIYEDVINVQ